jgi:hypothetical protein
VNLYSIYGACLGTDVEFPELRVLTGVQPKWTFSAIPRLEPAQDAAELGAELVWGEVYARLYRHSAGHRITVDDTGEFDLSRDGHSIRWQIRDASWPDFVRAHLMGRVLATSLFLDGWLPLHGSAVAFDAGAIGFLAPKGFGKSTLALALTALGGRLVTDDTLPVELREVPRAWPGVHSMRVNSDSLAAIGGIAGGDVTREGKVVVSDLPEDRLAGTPSDLRAVYMLDPAGDVSSADLPKRTQLAETIAALTLVSQTKIARMLGGSFAPALLERSVALVRAVPVYHLTTARDLGRIADTAARIAAWHT